ncbi:leucine--tRNA ligase [Candidatus Peregrinibacteria bacterium]|nr:leucine--tRNA ligase [Candidatus Peregrinibacteria bacterium]
MKNYNALQVEKKWKKEWKESGLYEIDLKEKKRKKFYNLIMFPYPSGDKLHIGHWYNYAPADSYARYMRMQGYNVFEPMGFDSFGLPAENYAIKTGIHPKESTEKNIEYMRKQLSEIGAMYDWNKEVVTSSPEYYKWTQWVFLQLYKNGLAYKKNSPVNWCPDCKTVLANEQVQNGSCDRCGNDVAKKDLSQWFFKITDYADKLLDYSGLDWPEKTIAMQENWIGKSYGCNIDFRLEDGEDILTTYTTRADTIYSVTFLCIAPEHPLVDELTKGTKYEAEVKKVRSEIDKQTLIERTSEGGANKLGCFLGKYAINPMNGEKVPVYMANFVLMYGTGVVMADAHDQRDFEFARKYDIPLKFVISEDGNPIDPADFEGAFVNDGILFDSGDFSGMHNREALPKMMDAIEGQGFGEKTVNFKLRDWLVSRQRYWGAPIPMVNCKKCGEVPVPEEDLPVTLPDDADFTLSDDGKSPLERSEGFMKCACPECGGEALREPDTMDTFVCSSWYFLRYPSSTLEDKPFDKKLTNKWLPVDMYIGGPEHACMHLLYARFINMVLHDLGFINFKEPFKRLVHQGMVTKDGAKMSKSKGNVVSPDEFVNKYGSDVFRMYLMFMGPFTEGGDWNDKGITGIARFVERFWKMINTDYDAVESMNDLKRNLHKLIKKVTEDIEVFHFNTAIAAMMEFTNFALKNGVDGASKKILVQLIAPLAPHLAEECWEVLEHGKSVVDSVWPRFDKKLAQDTTIKIGVQVNGKVRGEIKIMKDASEAEALEAARKLSKVQKYLAEGEVVKEIYVPGKIVGFVVKS